MPRVVSSKRKSSILPGFDRPAEKRAHHISVYNEFPDYEITLNDFEDLGKNRFLLLKWIENRRLQNKPLDEMEARFLGDVELEKPDLFDKIRELELHYSKNDNISHFVLRIACSSTEERAKWFVQYETILFERRYIFSRDNTKKTIHTQLKISSDELTKVDFLTRYNHLNGKFPLNYYTPDSTARFESDTLPLHRVPFHEVCELVARRGVVIHRGYAFVPHGKFHTVVRGRFRTRLNKSLAIMRRENTINRMREDESASRLVPLVENILKGLENSYRKSKLVNGEIRAQDLRKLKKHMPLCMSQIITEDCEKKKYARHWGILHLSLFLKGIGLPIMEAQRFWRASCKEERKYKEVSGSLRHMYGLTGARRDYTPFGCYKLVESVKDSKPEKDCHYGCPFAFYTPQKMVPLLRGRGLDMDQVKTVLELKQEKHYSMACRKVFESTHTDILMKSGLTIDDINSSWDHPNRYFDNSYHLHNPQKIEELTPDQPENQTTASQSMSQKPFLKPSFTPNRLRNTPVGNSKPIKQWTPQFTQSPKKLKSTPKFGKRTPTFARKKKSTPKFGSAHSNRTPAQLEKMKRLSISTVEEETPASSAMEVEEAGAKVEAKPAEMELEKQPSSEKVENKEEEAVENAV